MSNKYSDESLSIDEIVTRIITLNESLRDFWSSSQCWNSAEGAELLTRSRLDWQVSLSHSLCRWIQTPEKKEESAVQILGYANLGALVEGTLKLFLGVFFDDYMADPVLNNSRVQNPDSIKLQTLRQFFKIKIWAKTTADNWDPWIERLQIRRNAIHAFKDREIGTHSELLTDIRYYLYLIRRINSDLPYPDERPMPLESGDLEFLSACGYEKFEAPIL